jgi:nicotinate-nucleotide adenylyltransferase
VKIYIFGGSFDPPHRGHLEIINRCKDACDLFILVPSSQSPLKKKLPSANDNHRIRMLNLFIKQSEKKIRIEDWELRQGGMSYTCDTVAYLKTRYPEEELFLLIGADQLDNFKNWKNPDEILQNIQLIVFPREGFGNKIHAGIPFSRISDFNVRISSTLIREKITSRNFPYELLTPEIAEYIQQHHLYGLS